MNITADKINLVNNKISMSCDQPKVANYKTPDMENDSWEPSFGRVNVKAGVLKTLAVLLTTAFLVSCNKDKINEPTVTPEEPENTQNWSEEDLQFSEKARYNLESNPELLQSCLEYMAANELFYGANDLLNNEYPEEWKINVVMWCIMGSDKVDEDGYTMRAWFEQQIGEGKAEEDKTADFFEAKEATGTN